MKYFLYLCVLIDCMVDLIGKLLSRMGFGQLRLIRIEPISFKIRNVTLGIHGQDYFDPGSDVYYHSLTLGFFLFRVTFEFNL